MKTLDTAPLQLVRGKTPLYRQMGAILRAMIRDGLADPGPLTEQALCEKFGVSRTTVRQALQELDADGLVVRVQGRGTSFVAPGDSDGRTLRVLGTIEDLIAYAFETTYTLIERGQAPARFDVATLLKLPPGTSVYRFLGVRANAGTPFALIETWLPLQIGLQINPALDGNSPIIALLENDLGIEVSEMDQVLAATPAAPSVAEHIGLHPGEPTLLIRRCYFAASGQPLGLSINHCNPERFQYRLRLKRGRSRERGE